VDASTGRSERFFDPEPVIAALAKLPTIGEKTARSLAGNPFVQMNSARTGAVFNYDNDLYYAAADGSSAARLTSTPEPEENYSWSPDGRFIAFIRSNDLWVVDIATRTERALTSGGTDLVRNGKNDWVYFEELYNRNWRAYWWSPDSKRIAYLQVDSTQVPTFTLPVDLAEPQGIEKVPYPKPGQPNPAVKFGMVTVGGGSPRLADLSDYDAGQFLITGVGWFAAPEGQESPAAYCFVQNRTQTWMDMVKVPVGGGKPVRLFRETTPAWVEPLGNIRFLKDGSFLFPSERSGYKHWYRYDKDGKLIGPVTHGDFEARTIAHIDESAGLLYFTGTADSPIAENLYRIGLDGNGMSRLTSTPGSHSINFAPSGRLYIDSWSDHATPTRVALCSADGAQVRMLDTNPVYSIEEYRRGEYYLVHIPMSDGFILEGSVLSPPRIDPAKKYPVWLMTYAGPHAPTVSDTWGGGRTYDEMLAQMGIIVFRVDPRSASGKGAQSAWTAYKQLGVQELNDLEHAVKWLCSTGEWAGADSSPADSSRVGIAGGSYGGFMTAYAMTHSTAFAAGIATSSVTDWRDYDSIYTERYMGLPQDNPEGYDRTSVVKGAKNLHGTLLLQHGTMDDNVHMQNSIRLVRALEDAGKQFEFMVYPGSRHGVGGRHSRRMSVDFIRRVLGTGGPDD
jgi:dipeptidyl-peptidase-4